MKKIFGAFLIVLFLIFNLGPNVCLATPSPLIISFINVGEGDCILVQTPNKQVMLIDVGSAAAESFVADYLNTRHISRIDALITTHPHADHIGGMAKILYTFPVEHIYMPKVSANTWVYHEMMAAVKNKRVRVSTARAGMFINIDPTLLIEILAPKSDHYQDVNDCSLAIKLIYEKTSFLFTGDAGQTSEKEMIKAKYDLHADVLKVARHGSNMATTGKFLNAVAPKIAVISVGASNRHGYPGIFTLNKLKRAGVVVFRTDLNGTIQIISNGTKIAVKPGRMN